MLSASDPAPLGTTGFARSNGPAPLEGPLDGREVSEIVAALLRRRFTGTLLVAQSDAERTLAFRGGKLVSAASTHPDERLADLLLRRGRLSLAQYAAVVTSSEAALASLLDGQMVAKAATEQVHEIVFRAFECADGRYRVAAADERTLANGPRLRPLDPLIEAIRRVDSWDRVRKALGGTAVRYVRTESYDALLPDMTAVPERLAVLTRLNEEQTVEALCGSAGIPDFDACRLLWAFRVAGLAQRVDAVRRRVPAPVEDDGLAAAVTGGLPAAPRVANATHAAAASQAEPSAAHTDTGTKRILAVGVPSELLKRMEPLLSRAALVADRVPRAQSALVLCSQRRFDLVVVMANGADMPVGELLSELRKPGSKCARAQILLVTDQAVVPPELERLGVPVLPLQAPAKVMDEIAARVIGAEPRRQQRVTMRIELHLDTGRQLVMCQTENISKFGMLLRSEQVFPVGARLSFDFTPPGDRSPIRGKAEVVRHTMPDIEGVHGVGVKLIDFQADGRARWDGFLAKRDS